MKDGLKIIKKYFQGGNDMRVIQTLADVQALENDEHLPSFYIEEIKSQFLLWYESENDGEEIHEFTLPLHTGIYHLNHREDADMIEEHVNDIEFIDIGQMGEMKYFRIGIMRDHQMSVIYVLKGKLPYETESWLDS